ncbi:MAG: hypothetical protein RR513_05810 [Muribaculaceae bacterium]
MKRRNYESDFVAKMTLPQGIEMADFEIEFATGGIAKYRASRKNAVHVNCKTCDDGTVLVIFKNHGLSAGMLRSRFVSFLTNGDMPDGVQKCVTPRMQDVELVAGAGDDCGDVDFAIAVDYAVVDAYAMAVKAGYEGTQKAYVKMISKKAHPQGSGILHRKCISYYSPAGEVYTGGYMRFPGMPGSVFDVSKLDALRLMAGDNNLSDSAVARYDKIKNTLTLITTYMSFCCFVPINKDPNECVRLTSTGKVEIGIFPVARRTMGNKIETHELRLSRANITIPPSSNNFTFGFKNEAPAQEVQIWKKRLRHHCIAEVDPGQYINRRGYKKWQWVKVPKNGTSFGNENHRKYGIKFLMRVRRVNSGRNAFTDWQKFHVEVKNNCFVVTPSRYGD